MRKIKAFNIGLNLVAIIAAWSSPTKMEDKIFLTILFAVIIGFWLTAKGQRRFNNYKIWG